MHTTQVTLNEFEFVTIGLIWHDFFIDSWSSFFEKWICKPFSFICMPVSDIVLSYYGKMEKVFDWTTDSPSLIPDKHV